MSGARMSMLAHLRQDIGRLDGSVDPTLRRVALGHDDADATLQGGLVCGAIHEVFASGLHSAAATGFIAGLGQRLTAQKPLLWVRQDFAERENGMLAMSGWRELGLDPRCVVTVRVRDAESALQVTADALACDALGVVVLELWGETRQAGLVASRRLTLAARASGVTGLMLRIAAAPASSTAETRWVVRPAPSPSRRPWEAWGAPVLEARLLRNRHGQTGQWIMEWNCDECLFRDASFHHAKAHPQPVAATPADRSHQARTVTPWQRRAG
jgi:protein ImuA